MKASLSLVLQLMCRRYGVGCSARPATLGGELEHRDRVAPDDLLDGFAVEVLHLFLGDVAGLRPRAVRVRVVALVRHPVDADLVERLETVRVIEEAAVDMAPEDLARRLLHDVGDPAPSA